MADIDKNLAFAPATELKELITNKEVSPVEITQLYLDRIESNLYSFNFFYELLILFDSFLDNSMLSIVLIYPLSFYFVPLSSSYDS